MYTNLHVSLWQWADLDRIDAFGNATVEDCPGSTIVDVPFDAQNGWLIDGPAQAQVSFETYSYVEEGGGYVFDSASARKRTRLRGWDIAPRLQSEPNPDSRITIGEVTPTTVSGSVECEEPTMLDLNGSVREYDGRVIREYYSYYAGTIECDGTHEFTLRLSGEIKTKWRAGVEIWAYAYRISEPEGYYESVWDDHQAGDIWVTR